MSQKFQLIFHKGTKQPNIALRMYLAESRVSCDLM